MDKEELSEKEKDYLLTILYKQDWTEAEICDSIIRKLELNKIQSQNNEIEKICPIIQLIKLTREKIERDKWQIDKEDVIEWLREIIKEPDGWRAYYKKSEAKEIAEKAIELIVN